MIERTFSDLGKCDVCRTRPAVGVASTSMPMTAAYCVECAARGADPEFIFEALFADFGVDFDKLAEGLAEMETFGGGGYVTYREWATARAACGAADAAVRLRNDA